MEVTQELLNSIQWGKMAIFPEQEYYLLVLECDTKEQSFSFINLLLDNDFRFSFGESENGFPAFVLTFTKSGLCKQIISSDDKLFKYFENNQVRWLTTGFEAESGDVAYYDDLIEIHGFNYSNLN